MPLPDVPEPELRLETAAYGNEIIDVLVEESLLMIGLTTGTDGIQNDRDAAFGPVSKELPPRLDVFTIKDAPGDIF